VHQGGRTNLVPIAMLDQKERASLQRQMSLPHLCDASTGNEMNGTTAFLWHWQSSTQNHGFTVA
jgi:hypothetical protein